jgi:HPt (histidine-containing phosphotransfer) domain-containing protein
MKNIVTNLFNAEEALERLGQDEALLKHLIFTFQDDFTRQRDGLNDAIGSGEMAQVKKELHTLKGSSAAVGASGIAENIRALEERIAAGQAGWSEAVSTSKVVLQQLQAVQNEFKRWMESIAT